MRNINRLLNRLWNANSFRSKYASVVAGITKLL